MLQLLVSVARSTMVIGAILMVVVGALAGAATSEEMTGSRFIGFVLGGLTSLVISSVIFGVAAAIFDIQDQLRQLVALTKANPAKSTGLRRVHVPGVRASPLSPEREAVEKQATVIKPPRFKEGPAGWRALIAEAEKHGWKVSSGFSGVTFTEPDTGRTVRCNTVREAELELNLPD